MSYPGPRKPIIIPIPMSHLGNIDTTVAGQPTILKINLSGTGWDYYKRTILPYIWQGYQVKIRGQNTRQFPTNSSDMFKVIQADFIVKAENDDATSGSFGIYIGLPGKNVVMNILMKYTTKFYTENGIDYSHYSYVIYP